MQCPLWPLQQLPGPGRRARSTEPARVVYLSGARDPGFFPGSVPPLRGEDGSTAIFVFDVGLNDDTPSGAGLRSRGDSLFLRGLVDESISTIEGSAEGEFSNERECTSEAVGGDGATGAVGDAAPPAKGGACTVSEPPDSPSAWCGWVERTLGHPMAFSPERDD